MVVLWLLSLVPNPVINTCIGLHVVPFCGCQGDLSEEMDAAFTRMYTTLSDNPDGPDNDEGKGSMDFVQQSNLQNSNVIKCSSGW